MLRRISEWFPEIVASGLQRAEINEVRNKTELMIAAEAEGVFEKEEITAVVALKGFDSVLFDDCAEWSGSVVRQRL